MPNPRLDKFTCHSRPNEVDTINFSSGTKWAGLFFVWYKMDTTHVSRKGNLVNRHDLSTPLVQQSRNDAWARQARAVHLLHHLLNHLPNLPAVHLLNHPKVPTDVGLHQDVNWITFHDPNNSIRVVGIGALHGPGRHPKAASRGSVQGYLAHKKTPPPPGPP